MLQAALFSFKNRTDIAVFIGFFFGCIRNCIFLSQTMLSAVSEMYSLIPLITSLLAAMEMLFD